MRERSGQHLTHGPQRLVLRPWRRVCRCGFSRWPCYPQEMLRRQASAVVTARAAVRPRPQSAADVAPLLTLGQATRAHGGVR